MKRILLVQAGLESARSFVCIEDNQFPVLFPVTQDELLTNIFPIGVES